MAIKDFRFLRNDRGLKKDEPSSITTFRDVSAPIQQKTETIVRKFYMDEETRNSDIVELVDIPAITNALVTLFCTRKGARPLVPRMGLDLREYIGERLDEDMVYIMKDDIMDEIEEYEPRVKVLDLKIKSDPDDNSLELTLKCAFPELPGTLKNIFITLKNTGEVFTGIS